MFVDAKSKPTSLEQKSPVISMTQACSSTIQQISCTIRGLRITQVVFFEEFLSVVQRF